MSSNVPTSSTVVALIIMLVATLWIVPATMPSGVLTALTVVGVTATWVVSALATRPLPALLAVRLAPIELFAQAVVAITGWGT